MPPCSCPLKEARPNSVPNRFFNPEQKRVEYIGNGYLVFSNCETVNNYRKPFMPFIMLMR